MDAPLASLRRLCSCERRAKPSWFDMVDPGDERSPSGRLSQTGADAEAVVFVTPDGTGFECRPPVASDKPAAEDKPPISLAIDRVDEGVKVIFTNLAGDEVLPPHKFSSGSKVEELLAYMRYDVCYNAGATVPKHDDIASYSALTAQLQAMFLPMAFGAHRLLVHLRGDTWRVVQQPEFAKDSDALGYRKSKRWDDHRDGPGAKWGSLVEGCCEGSDTGDGWLRIVQDEKPGWMCITPACRKPSWNQGPGAYCSRLCRDGSVEEDKREELYEPLRARIHIVKNRKRRTDSTPQSMTTPNGYAPATPSGPPGFFVPVFPVSFVASLVCPERSVRPQCQFMIGIEQDNKFNVKGRIIGLRGQNMKDIVEKSGIGTKLRLRGRGSGFKEGRENKESDDPLMLCVSAPNVEAYGAAKAEITSLLKDIYVEYARLKRTNAPCIFIHEGPRDDE